MGMDTTTETLNAVRIRTDLLLRVREGDRIEVLFAANHEAQRNNKDFLFCLHQQVTLYELDYEAWTQEQMNRYNEIEDEANAAERVSEGTAVER